FERGETRWHEPRPEKLGKCTPPPRENDARCESRSGGSSHSDRIRISVQDSELCAVRTRGAAPLLVGSARARTMLLARPFRLNRDISPSEPAEATAHRRCCRSRTRNRPAENPQPAEDLRREDRE